MATLIQERQLRKLANRIERELKKMYGDKMGFFLIATPFNDADGVSDFISNIQREDSIKSLRETADCLENREVIPAAKGPVQ